MWSSAGVVGFKAPGKTPVCCQSAAEDVAKKAKEPGENLEVYIKGPGAGREAALRSLQAMGSPSS